jgi:hypothetical protein
LLLATTDKFLARQGPVAPEDVGGYEYRNNDFLLMSEDLEGRVPAFAPRLAGEGWREYDDQVSYLGPDGQLLADVAAFLRDMAARGLAFASRALARARDQRLDAAGALVAIVGLGVVGDVLVHGTHARFTTARGRPSRSFDLAWFDDLERFELEAMAVLDMGDAPRS